MPCDTFLATYCHNLGDFNVLTVGGTSWCLYF